MTKQLLLANRAELQQGKQQLGETVESIQNQQLREELQCQPRSTYKGTSGIDNHASCPSSFQIVTLHPNRISKCIQAHRNENLLPPQMCLKGNPIHICYQNYYFKFIFIQTYEIYLFMGVHYPIQYTITKQESRAFPCY